MDSRSAYIFFLWARSQLSGAQEQTPKDFFCLNGMPKDEVVRRKEEGNVARKS